MKTCQQQQMDKRAASGDLVGDKDSRHARQADAKADNCQKRFMIQRER